MSNAVPAGFRALPLSSTQLSLAAVLKCGQSFRWSAFPLSAGSSSVEQHEYRLCLRDRVVCLRQSSDTLFYRAVFPTSLSPPSVESTREAETLAFIKDYFQLDVDLVKLYEQWSNSDPVFKRFESRFSGIRILRQDPWENLVSFICSSNNNIPRITTMVQSLCQHYSPPLLSLPDPPVSTTSAKESEYRTYHPFPPPSTLAAPDVVSTLRSLGFGYRAGFIQKTARMLVDAHGYSLNPSDQSEPSEKWLMTLRNLDTTEARMELLKFVGVGPKVADCVLLMSLDKREVIPVDTHVCQIAIKYYGLCAPAVAKPSMTPKLYEKVNAKLVGVWGEYAGWAHSVLFTADLKSFSTYGLSPTTVSPAKRGRRASTQAVSTSEGRANGQVHSHLSGSTPECSATSPGKVEAHALNDTTDLSETDTSNLVDRVKRRRYIKKVT